jgi:hypothetical protein
VRRIQLIFAALAIVVTSFAAFAGPVMAQAVYEYTDNYSNQEGWVNGYYVNPDCYWYWDWYWGGWYYWCG